MLSPLTDVISPGALSLPGPDPALPLAISARRAASLGPEGASQPLCPCVSGLRCAARSLPSLCLRAILICEPAVKAQLLFCKKAEAVPRKVGLFQDSSGAAAPPPVLCCCSEASRGDIPLIGTQKSTSSCLPVPSPATLQWSGCPGNIGILRACTAGAGCPCGHLQPRSRGLGMQAPLWPCWDAGDGVTLLLLGHALHQPLQVTSG